jgi:serine/threonine protein kinase
MILEYMENGSLEALLNRRSLERVDVIQIALGVANGLLYLHSQNVQRDSRCVFVSNVMNATKGDNWTSNDNWLT